jgi:hypothetical protein
MEATLATKRMAICPTCQTLGEFEWIGEQQWPEEVAQRLRLPAIIGLWSCPHCKTTVSELALDAEADQEPVRLPPKQQTGRLGRR